MRISVLGCVVAAAGILLLGLSLANPANNQLLERGGLIFGILLVVWGVAIIVKPELARNRKGIFRSIPNAGMDRKQRST